jgi:hypothetical protein
VLPDARRRHWVEVARIRPIGPPDGAAPEEDDDRPHAGPMDADLAPLDAELSRAGSRAREAHRSRTEPTRFFAARLQARLVRDFEADRARAEAEATDGGAAGLISSR